MEDLTIKQDSEVRVEGALFKHEETTKQVYMRFRDVKGHSVYPNTKHKYVAKIANDSGYIGDYPLTISRGGFIMKTSDLVNLVLADYTLEVWETYPDKDGHPQTSIYPSPGYRVRFRVVANITDTTGELIKQIGFQEVVNSAVIAAGRNLAIGDVSTGDAGSNAQVKETYENGKNVLSFVLPRGKQGNQGGCRKTFNQTGQLTLADMIALFK